MGRDRQILDQAAALFYEKGFDGAGMDEIGERAGVSGPAIYHHFSGKDEILATLLTEGLDELIAATTVVHRSDPERELQRIVRHHVEFALDHRELVNVFQRESRSLTGLGRRHFQRRMRHYVSRWEATLARRYPAASATEVRCGAHAAIGLIHSVAYWPPSALRTEGLVDLLCRLVSNGLSALDAPAPSVSVGSRLDLA